MELVTSQQRPSVLADSFRATLASILYSGQNGDRPRVIVLTSANSHEGKTTVASNLALAAEIGQSVLLIDGDLRKGRLHEIFRVSNAWGLSHLLAGTVPPEVQESRVKSRDVVPHFLRHSERSEVVCHSERSEESRPGSLPDRNAKNAGAPAVPCHSERSEESRPGSLPDREASVSPEAQERTAKLRGLVLATGCGYLYLLPAGSPAPNISGLLYSPRAPEFLARMRQEFHTVIIDTPPMLNMPDARILGRMADAVILVVRSAETSRETAAAATQRLREDGTRVLGTILNEWDPRRTSHCGYAYVYPHYRPYE